MTYGIRSWLSLYLLISLRNVTVLMTQVANWYSRAHYELCNCEVAGVLNMFACQIYLIICCNTMRVTKNPVPLFWGHMQNVLEFVVYLLILFSNATLKSSRLYQRHNTDVTWASWRLKLQANLLFVQQNQCSISHVLNEWNQPVTSGLPSQRNINAESASIPWRLRDILADICGFDATTCTVYWIYIVLYSVNGHIACLSVRGPPNYESGVFPLWLMKGSSCHYGDVRVSFSWNRSSGLMAYNIEMVKICL